MTKKSSDSEKQEKLKCGLIMPIAAIGDYPEKHWANVKSIIEEALEDSGFQIDLVSNSDDVGVIQRRIVQNIYDNDIIVCDVSAKNPNVMFELGMRLAFDKPAIIIKDDKTAYSFDTAPIEHLAYPRDLNYHDILAFQKVLRAKVENTYKSSQETGYTTFLKHFGEFKIAGLEEREVSRDDFVLKNLEEISTELSRIKKQNQASFVSYSALEEPEFEFTKFYPIIKDKMDFELKTAFSVENTSDLNSDESLKLAMEIVTEKLSDMGYSKKNVALLAKKYLTDKVFENEGFADNSKNLRFL